ncbi:MAG: dihydroxyacetone kinase subunit DhaK [Acidimicrobiia bacterium]|nr:dihydroxyacetone kinase subunit DhaK [Acidimicrobiia bacterium]
MKKLINDPNSVVSDALAGVAAVHGDRLTVHRDPDFVRRSDSPVSGKVALISGGGSGHEPLHTGFVGPGMLDVACPGAIFTSPSATQIHAAAAAVATDAGVLFIVKNYTGDRLNFTMAADLLSASGVPTEVVVVNDDVAVEDSTHTAGRRGTGATLFVEKIAGAAAEAGASLGEVVRIARKVNENARSMGLALTSSIVPHVGSPNFEIGDFEVEMGVGIHGEPGRRRMPHGDATGLVAALADAVVSDLPFSSGDRVLALTNGLGGTPLIELYVVAGELASFCNARGITIERSLVGSYVTSLEMAGCTITLVKTDQEMLDLWDAPVSTTALRW